MLRRIEIFAVAVVVLLCLVNRADAATDYQLRSPNGKITVFIRIGERSSMTLSSIRHLYSKTLPCRLISNAANLE